MITAAKPSCLLAPLTPISTGVSPKLPELDGIELVAFDIYGTLLISAAGDISLADDAVSIESIERAIALLGERAKAIEFQNGEMENPAKSISRSQSIVSPLSRMAFPTFPAVHRVSCHVVYYLCRSHP